MRRTLRMMLAVLGVLLSAAGAWAAVSLDLAAPAYRFDNVYGPGDSGAQWVAITSSVSTTPGAPGAPGVGWSAGTRGGRVVDGMWTEADFVNSRDHVYIYDPAQMQTTTEAIETIFMVIPDFSTNLFVNFGLRGAGPGQLTTQEVLMDFPAYNVLVKNPLSTVPYSNWQFTFNKTANSGYDTQRGNMIFQQNPSTIPSQTLQIPMIVANVRNGTARQQPLLFRTTMRESFSNALRGNIVAYDRFEWRVDEDHEENSEGDPTVDWVFVPVEEFPIDANIGQERVNYNLRTEITNYSGTRYEMQRYDALGIQRTPLYPSKWTMDLPPGVTDVDPDIRLDELSHVAPGLITTYDQPFNIISNRQNIFDMYPVDPAEGHRKLTLMHPTIFGQELGASALGSTAYNDYTVTGFKLLTSSLGFLRNVALTMGVKGVAMPEVTDNVMNNAVTHDVFVTADAVNTIKVESRMPNNLVTSGDTAGLLPLHITLNLPRSNRFVLPLWNDFYEEWRRYGSIKNTFARHFSVYTYDAKGNTVDLFKWLDGQRAYGQAVKVFMDEGQGTLSGEGDCITVSFIVMLMDSSDKSMRLVRDQSASTDNSYMIINDGNLNDTWDMTFFSAPLDVYAPAPGDDDGGGSGCSAGIPVLALLFVCGFTLVRKVG